MTATERIKVMLVDDHPIMRSGLRWRARPLRDGSRAGTLRPRRSGCAPSTRAFATSWPTMLATTLHLHRVSPRLPDGEGRDAGAGRGSVNRVNDWDSATRRFFLLSALSGLNGCLKALGRPTVCPATSRRRFCLPYPLAHQTGQNEDLHVEVRSGYKNTPRPDLFER